VGCLAPVSSIETYRGTVYRWEVDNVDHFTVAFYFSRFEDATLAALHALGLEPGTLAGAGKTAVTRSCDVRYLRELRVGDLLHIRSGVLDVAADSIELGHQVYDSGDDALCTSVEQRVALVETGSRSPVPLTAVLREAAERLRAEWPRAAAAAVHPVPEGDGGFVDTARDTIKPWEVDVLGYAAFPAYVHRFSAANGHVLAGFGVTPAYMRAENRGFSTFEFRLRFPGSLRAGDPVLVRSGLLHVGTSSMRFLHRMANARTGEVVATLEQAGVHLDMEARRPTPLPDAFRERARAMLAAAAITPRR
jgi:acyl-CoA thioesterase FadM